MGIHHANRFGFGVHRGHRSGEPPRIVTAQCTGGTVLGRHQRQLQHFAAGQFTANRQARTAGFQVVEIVEIDRQSLVHVLLSVEHDHRGHQLGDAGDGGDGVGVFRVNRLARTGVEN